MLLGVPVTVVMPRTAPLAKVDKCRVRCKHNIFSALNIDFQLFFTHGAVHPSFCRNLEHVLLLKVHILERPRRLQKH